MSKNDAIILESILKQSKVPELTDEENFEYFAYEQILKDYELSYEELMAGKIGGIDGIGVFVFVNDELIDNELIEEDANLDAIKDLNMKLFLIRAKNSFSDIYTENIIQIIKDIFDFHSNSDKKIFRQAYLKLVPRDVNVQLVAVSKTYDETGVSQKIENIRKMIMESLQRVNFNYRLVNPSELLRLTYKEKSYTLQLRFKVVVSEENSYWLLSTLSDYGKFVSDEDGKLRRYLFDSNIRDYQKQSGVNKDIAKSLRTKKNIDFWWLNNGITILAKKAIIESRGIIKLDDVQIINGLQTTNVVYEYLKESKEKDDRLVAAKIVITNDSTIRDDIIKAANYQNPIAPTSLRASDHIQYNIESYLLNSGWYYDRRKNYYKNMGKPADKIISIAYLAQTIAAMVLREPNRSRKNPTSLTKADKDYYKIFGSQNYPVYLFCIKTMKAIDNYLHTCKYEESYRTNFRWHLATFVIVRLLKKKYYTEKDLESILKITPVYAMIDDVMSELSKLAKNYLDIHDITLDAMAKNREFVNFMLEKIIIEGIDKEELINDIGEIEEIDGDVDKEGKDIDGKEEHDIQSDLLSYKNM